MNTTQQLTDALFVEPDDFTLAAALVEHLECDRDMWRSEAERQVEEIQRAGRDHRNITAAAEVLDEDSGYRMAVMGVIAAQCDLDAHRTFVVYVVGGDGPPTARLVDPDPKGNEPMEAHITVPALTVMRAYRSIVHLVRRDHWTKARSRK